MKGYFWGVGRRKSAVARVRLKEGSGKIEINKREYTDYFRRERDRVEILKPLKDTKTLEKFDVFASVKGGGISGQAGAVALGIARSLLQADASLEDTLRKKGHLTRDSRIKERKKYGKKGARASFQYSKR
ncbi:MAG: 30S ribosomal protein S9 [Planctomycetota bacterium]|nr:MAG: 30S ribosomal protein S9 [Planctomycetota bacterium]